MDEFRTVLKAREFLRRSGVESVPVDIGRLAAAANATVRVAHDLADDESGHTTSYQGRHFIIVNGNHSEERQRFTVLHEIGHIVLELPSKHHGATVKTGALLRYARRPEEEMLCDVFAAECLLPHELFAERVVASDISLDAVKSLARVFGASLTTTGSRFAFHANEPCAFVLSEEGRARYVSRSKYLRELKGWIGFGVPVPRGSVAHRLMAGGSGTEEYDEVPTDVWFNGGIRNRPMVAEESILLPERNQCLSLVWLDETLQPVHEPRHEDEEDEPLLAELDGILPWPSRRRKK